MPNKAKIRYIIPYQSQVMTRVWVWALFSVETLVLHCFLSSLHLVYLTFFSVFTNYKDLKPKHNRREL